MKLIENVFNVIIIIIIIIMPHLSLVNSFIINSCEKNLFKIQYLLHLKSRNYKTTSIKSLGDFQKPPIFFCLSLKLGFHFH